MFLLLIVDLYFLIPAVIIQIFNTIAEVIIPIGIPIKEAKAEMETHPKHMFFSNLCNVFYASYSFIYFHLFL